MPRKKKAGETPLKRVGIPIRWAVPPDEVSLPVTNVVVQHDDHEFFISFFEILPPLVFGKGEVAQRQLEGIKEVEARFLTRVKVTAGRLQSFIDVLQQNLDSFRKEQPAVGPDKSGGNATDR